MPVNDAGSEPAFVAIVLSGQVSPCPFYPVKMGIKTDL